jgi:chromosome segregation ATPase
MRRMAWIPALVVLVAAGVVVAGEPADTGKPALVQQDKPEIVEQAGPELVDMGRLEPAELVAAIKEQLSAIEALRAQMQQTLEAMEAVDAEVATLRQQRLEQRLNEIAALGPEMEAAVEKLRLLRKRAEELRTELDETKQAQREAFDALKIEGEDKDVLAALMSDRELPVVPPDDQAGPPPGSRRGGDAQRRGGPDRMRNIQARIEQQREERRRRLEELKQADPELHAIMLKKVELIEQLDGPRAELAEHVAAVQQALQALQRRLGDFQRAVEQGTQF